MLVKNKQFDILVRKLPTGNEEKKYYAGINLKEKF